MDFAPVLGQPAVNVGTTADPIWFAQEQLRILPYQIYRKPVSEKLTGSMVKEAAKIPKHGRAFIEGEGLAALGFTTNATLSQTLTRLVSS